MRILLITLAVICYSHALTAQDMGTFEDQIQGIWTVQSVTYSNKSALKKPSADEIFERQKSAQYILSFDATGLELNLNMLDGTSFMAVALVSVDDSNPNTGVLDLSWKVGTDKKLLKKYGLTDVFKIEVPDEPNTLRLSVMKADDETESLITFYLTM